MASNWFAASLIVLVFLMFLSFSRLVPVVQPPIGDAMGPTTEEQRLQEKKEALRAQVTSRLLKLQREYEGRRAAQEGAIHQAEAELMQLLHLNATLHAPPPSPSPSPPAPAGNETGSAPCHTSNHTLRNLWASPGDRLKYAKKAGPPTDEQCTRLQQALTPRHNCSRVERMGRKGPGGYDVCLSPPLPAPSTACVSYSFGLGQDWAYEIELSGLCYTYAFDPTLYRKPNRVERYEGRQIDFYKFGLTADGRRFCHRGANEVWSKTLAGTMARLGHREVDVLKLSVDEAEWEVLLSMDRPDTPLQRVAQLTMELHFHYVPVATALDALAVLQQQGFALFSSSWASPAPPTAETFKCGLLAGQVSYLRLANHT
eukprot:GGOE01049724.1.p1 GENE.GGOE01049724.1~~GGOE01049724.1.p1  ORF type:complete len:371 (-),score=104.11 GGOE01049724.1:31-1143(-)